MGSPKGGTVGGGSIATFKYNDSSFTWDQYGARVQGSTTGEDAGYAISLSNDGSKMVVGFPRAANTVGSINAGKNAGRTAVYSISGLEWQVLGQEGDLDGESVAMSRDGSVVVIGGKGRSEVNATTGEIVLKSTGHCRVFLLQASEWKFLHSLVGKFPEEHLGESVGVSSDGTTVACGGVAQKSGVVRLWNRATLQESTIWPRGEEEAAEGSTFGSAVAISEDGEYVIVGAPGWGFVNGGPSAGAGAIHIFRDALS